VLWYGPPALLVAGLAGTLVWLRHRRPSPTQTMPLSAEEISRLNGLMHGTDA
jgi:uncharacterized membrane protein